MERGRRLFNHCVGSLNPYSSFSFPRSLSLSLCSSFSQARRTYVSPFHSSSSCARRETGPRGSRNREQRHLHFTRENTLYGPGPIIAPQSWTVYSRHARMLPSRSRRRGAGTVRIATGNASVRVFRRIDSRLDPTAVLNSFEKFERDAAVRRHRHFHVI